MTQCCCPCLAGTFTPKQLNQLKTVYKSSIDYATSDKSIKVRGAAISAAAILLRQLQQRIQSCSCHSQHHVQPSQHIAPARVSGAWQ
jgi:hypothetical protein